MILALSLLSSSFALEPGPYEVASRDVVIPDARLGEVYARVHFPASAGAPDPSGGPYPVAAFLHGYLGSAWMYMGAADHLASLGFVVVNMDTQTGLYLDYDQYARESRAALRWVDAASDRPGHWLAGMASDGDWTALGHSMGGGTLARLTELEPRVRVLVGFAPYLSERAEDYDAFAAFDGDALYLTGDLDDTSTPAVVDDWFERMQRTSTGLFVTVDGIGHQAVCDLDFGEERMSNEAQLELVLGLASDFLAAEVLGDEARIAAVLDAPGNEAVASNSRDPFMSFVPAGDARVDVSLAATVGAVATVYAGDGPDGAGGLVGAVEVASIDLPRGAAVTTVALPAALAGRAWLQVRLVDGDWTTLGVPVDVFGVGAPIAAPEVPPTEDAPAPVDGVTEQAPVIAARGGCDQGGVASWWLLPLLPLIRRRR